MDSSIASRFKRRKVYFEKQEKDRLCGVHCLNALMQGPFFDAIQLSEIALNLDKMEKSLYGRGESFNEVSQNVDEDGNYNVQVLSEALKKHGTEIVPLRNSEAVKLLEKEMENLEAFIFNSSTHWYAIRKIDGIWFNLNSTNANPGPEIISDFYLSAYIKGSEQIGYTNFLVRNLPQLLPLDAMLYANLQYYQKLVTIEDIVAQRTKNDQRVKNLDKGKPKKDGEGNEGEEEKEKEEDKNKFKAFTGKGVLLGNDSEVKKDDGMDDELRQAMQLSLNDYISELERELKPEPAENDPDSYTIVFKHNDATYTRRFRGDDKIVDLKLFVKYSAKTFSEVEISETFPRKIYTNDFNPIKSEGISKRQVLFVKLL